MLTQKKLEKFAHNYRLSTSWDKKVEIVREIYNLSEKGDRKFNLSVFGELVGRDFQYLYKQGQLELHNVRKRQKKYKQNVTFKQAKKNLEKKRGERKNKNSPNCCLRKMHEDEIKIAELRKTGRQGGKHSRKDVQVYQSLR